MISTGVIAAFVAQISYAVFAVDSAVTEVPYYESNIPDVTCSLPNIPASRVTGHRTLQYAVGDKTEITCDNNYMFAHTPTTTIHVQCGPDGKWLDLLGNPFIACERVGGCHLPRLSNGGIMSPKVGGYMPGERAPLECRAGYSFSTESVQVVKCDVDGKWKTINDQALPECKVKLCDNPLEVKHAHMKEDPVGGRTEGSKVSYVCNTGYRSSHNGSHVVTCKDGRWVGNRPTCTNNVSQDVCSEPDDIPNSYKNVFGPGMESAKDADMLYYEQNTKVLYFCFPGYNNISPRATLTCIDGKWQGGRPQCIKACTEPPKVDNGILKVVGKELTDTTDYYVEGTQVVYSCASGYARKDDKRIAVMMCENGEWQGYKPQCEKRQYCDKPQDIQYGNWIILTQFAGSVNFAIGTKIMYECGDGYKSIGTVVLSCLSTGYWSSSAPSCVEKDKYCSEPAPVSNGYYMCKPSPCGLHKVGTEVHYMCYEGYAPKSGKDLVHTCQDGGKWTGHVPTCHHVNRKQASGNIVNINASTMTVVIATSSGILGLLIVVMVIVALQRRMKPRALCPPCPAIHSPQPQQYPEPRGATVDEHDRVALIAFADGQHGVSVVLPSYEEATRGRVGPRLSRFNSDASSHSSSGRSSRGDYRPLPSIPHSLRGGTATTDYTRDHHRNSIITTASTTTRDNLSLAFGSMDTVNVSDGTSASVTVDTYDSMASNPSIATSQRATAGSIESSSTHGSLANEDAPLLEGNCTNTDTLRSLGSRSMESYTNTDTLLSQTHSEASAIAEVPEENRDEMK